MAICIRSRVKEFLRPLGILKSCLRHLMTNPYNYKYNLSRIIRNPLWAILTVSAFYKFKSKELGCLPLVAYLTRAGIEDVKAIYNQLKSNTSLYEHLERCFKLIRGRKDTGIIGVPIAEILYLLTRLLKPEKVIETGVANGESSTFILQALEDNGRGQLYSIDLPPPLGYEFLDGRQYYISKGKEIGWLIPSGLRHRWHLIIGNSSKELPILFKKLGNIDIFLHDSLHTDKNMLWEYETAWPFIKEEGLLLSHDISRAFLKFSERMKHPYHQYRLFLGGIVKQK